MFPLVEAYRNSEQTQIQFCQDHDLSVAVLGYWLRKYEAAAEPVAEEVPSGTAWVELTPSAQAAPGAAALELIYPNGVRLRLPAGVAVAYVHQLIHYPFS